MTGEQGSAPGPEGAPAWSRDAPAGGLALELAAAGWHVLPLAAVGKRPLANCAACASHSPDGCGCLSAGRWCHGVRAATTDPVRISAWWQAEPSAVPGVAAGPSGLVLVDLDNHHPGLPPDPAVGLLPGIDLAAEPVAPERWRAAGRIRDGRDTLLLLAELRGGPHPWQAMRGGPPVTVATPSGGRHLWYQAPRSGLRQAISDPAGRRGLGWQIDIKAGWSYGLAPGVVTRAGRYRVLCGDPRRPGAMPGWLAREVSRVCQAAVRPAAADPWPPAHAGRAGAAYLSRVIDNGARSLAKLEDGRKRALEALAYQAGGLLAWSGLAEADVISQLTDAGTAAGLAPADARKRVTRSLANGMARPITPAPAGRSFSRPC